MHSLYTLILALGCAGSLVLINKVFGTDPIGRTFALFGTFFVQEGKRKIKVDDMIGYLIRSFILLALYSFIFSLRYLQQFT